MNNEEQKVETMENEAVENNAAVTEETQIEITKSNANLWTWFCGLKWWQKAAIIAGGATVIYVGGKYVLKVKADKKTLAVAGEVAKQTIETAAETIAENPETVVETVAEVVTE